MTPSTQPVGDDSQALRDRIAELEEALREADVACRELAWWTLPVAPPDDLMAAARDALRAARVVLARDESETARGDADTQVAWLRDGARDLEKAHAILDQLGVPRDNPESGNPFTLAARVAYLHGVR